MVNLSERTTRILKRLIPDMTVYFVMVFIYSLSVAVCAFFAQGALVAVAVCGLVLNLLSIVIFARLTVIKRRETARYIESIAIGAETAKGFIGDLPIPSAVAKVDTGDILWSSEAFSKTFGSDIRLRDILPGLDPRTIGAEGLPFKVGDMWYEIYSYVKKDIMSVSFVDCTALYTLRNRFEKQRPVVGIVLIDAYEEITKNLSDTQKSAILADVDEVLNQWIIDSDCILRRFDRDKYFVFCERGTLDKFAEERFSVIDAAHAVVSRDIPVTLSIGFGVNGDSYADMLNGALSAIDMALSRGGDQAVIRDKQNFSFYGGHSLELEKRTKVKSRVTANALRQLILDSSDVIIMGHANADLDSIGAAAGIVFACRTLGRPAYIVIDRAINAAESLIARLESEKEYEGVFINERDAMVRLSARTLLVVVDTHRPEFVQSPPLLHSAARVAVIDHHRRGADYISDAALSLHEPYASSASELVCEIVSYFDTATPYLRAEADALLAGIVLDTKSFSIRTGARTFEAAAMLRLAGADPIEIKRLFQIDFESYLERFKITSRASYFKNQMVISLLDYTVGRVVAAQAADDLLTLSGVQASFIVFPENEKVIISARSLGKVNVQIIMEKLGGGGHLSMAGAQLEGETTEGAMVRLYAAIEDYLKSCNL